MDTFLGKISLTKKEEIIWLEECFVLNIPNWICHSVLILGWARLDTDSATNLNNFQPAQISQFFSPPLEPWTTKSRAKVKHLQTQEKRRCGHRHPGPEGSFSISCREKKKKDFCAYSTCSALHPSLGIKAISLALHRRNFLRLFFFSVALHSDSQDTLESFEGLIAHFSQVLLCFFFNVYMGK